MHKIVKNSILVVLLSALSIVNTQAWYIGMGTAMSEVNTYSIDKERLYDVTLKAGYTYYDYLDFEFRGDFQTRSFKELLHPYSYGLFIKPNYDISKHLNTYMLLGMSKNKLKTVDKKQTNNITVQNDFSYGVGLEYSIGDNFYIYSDFLRYIDKSTTQNRKNYAININTVSLGLIYKFGGKTNNYPHQKVKHIHNNNTKYTYSKSTIKNVERFVKDLQNNKNLKIQINSYLDTRYKEIKRQSFELKELFIKKGITDKRIDVLFKKDKKFKGHIRVFKKEVIQNKIYDGLVVFED